MKQLTYVLADGDWNNLRDGNGEEFRYTYIEDARKDIPRVSLAREVPEDQIIIIEEIRQEVK